MKRFLLSLVAAGTVVACQADYMPTQTIRLTMVDLFDQLLHLNELAETQPIDWADRTNDTGGWRWAHRTLDDVIDENIAQLRRLSRNIKLTAADRAEIARIKQISTTLVPQ